MIRRPPTRSIPSSRRHHDSMPDPRLFSAALYPVSTSACCTMKIDDQSHDTLMDSASLREGLDFEEEVESDESDYDDDYGYTSNNNNVLQ